MAAAKHPIVAQALVEWPRAATAGSAGGNSFDPSGAERPTSQTELRPGQVVPNSLRSTWSDGAFNISLFIDRFMSIYSGISPRKRPASVKLGEVFIS